MGRPPKRKGIVPNFQAEHARRATAKAVAKAAAEAAEACAARRSTRRDTAEAAATEDAESLAILHGDTRPHVTATRGSGAAALLLGLGQPRQHLPETAREGVHWTMLPGLPYTEATSVAFDHLLSPAVWADVGVKSVPLAAAFNPGVMQIVLVNEGRTLKRSTSPLRDAALHADTLVRAVCGAACNVKCPACKCPMADHVSKENFLSRMEVGSQLGFHVDRSGGQSTVSMMLHPAEVGGLLRICHTPKGIISSQHIHRETDVPLLDSTGSG
jgi:hypothetical protein